MGSPVADQVTEARKLFDKVGIKPAIPGRRMATCFDWWNTATPAEAASAGVRKGVTAYVGTSEWEGIMSGGDDNHVHRVHSSTKCRGDVADWTPYNALVRNAFTLQPRTSTVVPEYFVSLLYRPVVPSANG